MGQKAMFVLDQKNGCTYSNICQGLEDDSCDRDPGDVIEQAKTAGDAKGEDQRRLRKHF